VQDYHQIHILLDLMHDLDSAMVASHLSNICEAHCQQATMISASTGCKRSTGSLRINRELVAVRATVCRCDALAVFHETVENSTAQSKACDFLVSKQRKDGGWAESYLSSQTKVALMLINMHIAFLCQM